MPKSVTVTDFDPIRRTIREHCWALSEECLAEAERCYTMLNLQRCNKGHWSLNPRQVHNRISRLTEAANQCIDVAKLVQSGANLPECPDLLAEHLLPRQSWDFLDSLGDWHKLFIGKVGAYYARPKRR